MPFHVNDGGTWKTPEVWLNDQGTWKRPEVWVNDAGTWRLAASPVVVTIAPSGGRSGTGTATSFDFASLTITVTGGTATAFSWGFLNASGGTFSVLSGQGTNNAVGRVTGVIDSAQSDMFCDVTVGGQVIRVSAPLSYIRSN